MPALAPEAPIGTPQDLSWLRRGWWVVVLAVFVGAVAGLLLATVAPKSYEAKTAVLVLPTIAADGSTIVRNGEVNMDNEIQIVRSQPVAEEARALLRVATPTDELVKQISVVVPANTYILQITAEADTAEGALTLSHAFAEGYLSARGSSVQADVDAQIKELGEQKKALTAQLLTANKDAGSDNVTTAAVGESNRQILVPQISQLNQRLASLSGAAVDPGTIINDARLPDSPTSPVPLLYAASGAALGFLVGLMIAYAIGGRRRRVRSASDLAGPSGRAFALEVSGPVAEVGLLPTGRGGEVFDRLRLALISSVPAERPAVLVCPATKSAGASLVTVNLASSLARIGHRVLILCADPLSETPSVLGVKNDGGLADCLREGLELAERVQISTFSARVAVVAPGRDLAEAVSVNSAERLAVLLLKLRQDTSLVRPGDFVLVETPDTTQGVDAQELARVVDCCVVVAENGRATVRDVERTESDLASVSGTVAAHVVVPALPLPVTSEGSPLDVRLKGSGDLGNGRPDTASVTLGTDGRRS